jgi:hypothetical protein
MKISTRNIAILALGLCIWFHLTTHSFSMYAVGSILIFVAASWCVGSLVVAQTELKKINEYLAGDVPKIIFGLPLFVMVVFVVGAIIQTNVLISCGATAAIFIILELRRQRLIKFPVRRKGNNLDELAFVLLAFSIVTLWCIDLLSPIQQNDGKFIIKAWQDVYYHLAQISSISKAENLRAIQAIQMAGNQAQPYHIGAYILPSVLMAVTGESGWSSYAGFMVPLGLLLTCFAAYTLIVPWYGNLAGMVSGIGILLLPDASQMGISNGFFSYHWLQQIAPAGMYGVVAAVCSIQMSMIGARGRLWRCVLLSYIYLCIVLLFKAHIFVAASYPILIVPILFWPEIKVGRRILILILATVLFSMSVAGSQLSASVPTLRLDGSSLWEYSESIRGDLQQKWWLKSAAGMLHVITRDIWSARFVASAILLILVTVSVYFVVLILETKKIRNSQSKVIVYFPFIVFLVFLVMSLCLSYDRRGVGMPEELLHRPFVWMYFCVVTTMLGMICRRLQTSVWITSSNNRLILIATFLCLTYVPIHFSRNIQTMSIWDAFFPEVDVCLYEATEYIKSESSNADVVLTQGGDPKFAVAALSERQAYAIDAGGYRAPPGLENRLAQMRSIESEISSRRLETLFINKEIQWYLALNRNVIPWTKNENITPVYECENVAVYTRSSFKMVK